MLRVLKGTTALTAIMLVAGSAFAADYEFVNAVDESGSMANSHTFLQNNYTKLDDIKTSTTTFAHGIFGFANSNTSTSPNNPRGDAGFTFNGSLFGTDSDVQTAAGQLNTVGSSVDPFAAGQFALDNYSSSFSSGAVKNVVIWTDTTCELGSSCFSSSTFQSNLTSAGAKLHVVTSQLSLKDTGGNTLVAVVKINGTLYGFDANGTSTTAVDDSTIVSSAYKTIVLDSGGVLADLNAANSNGDGFVAAFQAAIEGVVTGTVTTSNTQDDQQNIISETSRVTVRAVARQVAAAIQKRIRSVGSTHVQSALNSGRSTGINAGDTIDLPFAVWADATYSSLDKSSTSEAFDGDTKTGLVGVDTVPMKNLVVGVAFGFETTDLNLKTSNGDKETDGLSGFVYAGYTINQYVSIDSLVGYGGFSTDISEARNGAKVKGDYDSSRYLASLSVNGTYEYEKVLFTGTVGYLFTHEDNDSYTASDGSRVNPDNTNLGQGSIGLEVGYLFDNVYPYIRGAIENDFVTESGADRTGGNVGAGVLYSPVPNLTLGANTSYDVGREDEENFSIGINARYQF